MEVSIYQLAKLSGYTYSHVSRVLNGKNDPSLKCARKLSTLLGMTLDEFVNHIDRTSTVKLWPLEDS